MSDEQSPINAYLTHVMSRRAVLRSVTRLGAWASAAELGLGSRCAASAEAGHEEATSRGGATVPVAGTGDALFAALPQGAWANAIQSQTIREAIARYAPDYREFGDTGITAITSAWSGAAFDPESGTFYIMGGGHHDSNFNGMVSLNAETGRAGMPIHPSILTAAEVKAMKASWPSKMPWNDWGHATYPGYPPPTRDSRPYPGFLYPDGLPGASHTYGCMWYDAPGKVINFNAFWSSYDVLRGKVSSLTPHLFGARGPNNIGLKVGRRLFGVNTKVNTYWYMAQFDLQTLTETPSDMSVPNQPGSSAAYSFNSKTFGCAIGNTLYFVDTSPASMAFGDPIAWSVDVARVATRYTARIIPVVDAWSPADMAGVQTNTMAYDSDTGWLYIPSKDWRYFLLWNPLTGRCNKMNISGAVPKTQINSAYGRLQYYSKHRCLVLVNSVDEPLYYLKLG